MARSLYFLILSGLSAIVFSQLYFHQQGGHESVGLAGRLVAASPTAGEFLLMAGAVCFLANGRAVLRLIAYALFIVFMLVCSAQFAAMHMTGDFLTPTAIVNAQHVALVMSPERALAAGLVAAVLLLLVLFGEFKTRKASWLGVTALLIACGVGGAVLKLDTRWLDKESLESRNKLFYSNVNLGNYTAPVQALYLSSLRLQQTLQQHRPLSAGDVRRLADFGISFDPDADYPLVKDFIYRGSLPFDAGVPGPGSMPLNVIVFLSEGLSARVMQPYDGHYPGLTPNIEAFARSAMRVDNYYNHTFATYRGLLGQLCSIFPVYAGGQINEGTNYWCLGDLFNEEGYDTYFLFSQQAAKTKLDELLAKTNISNIYGQEDLQALFLAGEEQKRPLALSDQQFLKAATGLLRSLEERRQAGDAQPFFIGLYNIETHAYYEPSDDGVVYDGRESYILDSIHNYDDAFGKFWRYFQASSLADNTIIVFTTDHTHFQGKDFVELVDDQPDYPHLFVDRIPLLIHHPRADLPAGFDARHASSIDLAPTIAHLMGFANRPNPFMGRSLFDRNTDEGLAFGEGYVFLIGKDGIALQGEYLVDAPADSKINLLYKTMSQVHVLEKQGRVWNRGE